MASHKKATVLTILCLLLAAARGSSHCRSDSCASSKTSARGTAWLQVRNSLARGTHVADLTEECHTAVAPEVCHEAVQWAMATGIRTNPDWYPGLTASSSFEEFQAVLHVGGHADCPEPCAACHTAVAPEKCHGQVEWAMATGIHQNPDWYPGLSASSSFEEFQAVLHNGGHGDCPVPCPPGSPTAAPTPAPTVPAPSGEGGWHPTSERVGNGHWCNVGVPAEGWVLTGCDNSTQLLRVKVLSYNLFWWNLFGRRHGNHGSAGKLIRQHGEAEPFELMAFQEADDVARVLRDAGMLQEYGIVAIGGSGWAYRKSNWKVLAHGSGFVGEDRREQWYGKRPLAWGRLEHKETGKTVFFANHHGPLPVNTGGLCGGRATALNIVKMIAQKMRPGDAVIMGGDFNAGEISSEIKELDKHLVRLFTGTAIGGIDHFYSNCGMSQLKGARKLGRGGSDHDAIEAILEI